MMCIFWGGGGGWGVYFERRGVVAGIFAYTGGGWWHGL